MKTLKKIKLNGLNDAELRDREMDALNGGDRTCGCGCNYEGSGGSTTHNMELLTIKSVLAAEIQLVDVLLMVVILYLEQLYNNEPCSKYAVR